MLDQRHYFVAYTQIPTLFARVLIPISFLSLSFFFFPFFYFFLIFESVLTSFFILFFWSKYLSHFNYTNSFKSLYENILGLLSHVLGCEVKISLPDTENFIVVLLVVLNKEQLRWMDTKKNKLNIIAKMKLS